MAMHTYTRTLSLSLSLSLSSLKIELVVRQFPHTSSRGQLASSLRKSLTARLTCSSALGEARFKCSAGHPVRLCSTATTVRFCEQHPRSLYMSASTCAHAP